MKTIFLTITLIIPTLLFSQRNCNFDVEVKDSLGTLKSIKEILMYERVFGNNEQYLFFSLSNSDGTPFLSLQQVQKNNIFINTNCLDKNSKIYIQLENDKIITLIHTDNEFCSTLIQEQNKNMRVLSGNFLFLKNSFEELKKSPIKTIRIKYSTETVDYLIKSELQSELLKEFYRPANYFIDYLHCVEN